jgi:hypothetical protein
LVVFSLTVPAAKFKSNAPNSIAFADGARIEVMIGRRLANQQPKQGEQFSMRIPRVCGCILRWLIAVEIMLRGLIALHEGEYRACRAELKDVTSCVRSRV